MSEHSAAVEHGPAAHRAEHERCAHMPPLGYARVAVVLVAITAMEVGVYYVDSLRPVLAPLLITLSAIKFATVVAMYMGLRWDSKLFTWFFVGGLALAASIILALMTLMGFWWRAPLLPGHH